METRVLLQEWFSFWASRASSADDVECSFSVLQDNKGKTLLWKKYVPYLSVLKPGSYTSRGSNILRLVKLRCARLNIVLIEMGRLARLYAGSKIIYKK